MAFLDEPLLRRQASQCESQLFLANSRAEANHDVFFMDIFLQHHHDFSKFVTFDIQHFNRVHSCFRIACNVFQTNR